MTGAAPVPTTTTAQLTAEQAYGEALRAARKAYGEATGPAEQAYNEALVAAERAYREAKAVPWIDEP